MLGPIVILLSCQLVGETIARSLGLPVPGPVIGVALLFAILLLHKGAAAYMAPTTRTLLSHLSLLFVPAGVGVIGNLGILAENWLAIAVILVVSTLVAIAVAVGAFVAVQRLTGERA